MEEYTDNHYRAKYNQWRDLQDSHNYVMSYKEWLDTFVYKTTVTSTSNTQYTQICTCGQKCPIHDITNTTN